MHALYYEIIDARITLARQHGIHDGKEILDIN